MTSVSAITFEPVDHADFDTLIAIRIEAMRESLERVGRFDPIRARERFRIGFSPEHAQYIVINNERVGFVVMKPQDDSLLLDHLYIKTAWQNRGIGTAVLDQVFRKAD